MGSKRLTFRYDAYIWEREDGSWACACQCESQASWHGDEKEDVLIDLIAHILREPHHDWEQGGECPKVHERV